MAFYGRLKRNFLKKIKNTNKNCSSLLIDAVNHNQSRINGLPVRHNRSGMDIRLPYDLMTGKIYRNLLNDVQATVYAIAKLPTFQNGVFGYHDNNSESNSIKYKPVVYMETEN
jgi:hypothetical protein